VLQSTAGLHTSGPLLVERATSIFRAMAGQWLGARQQAPQVLAALQDRAAGWSQEDVTRLASLGACNIGHRGGHNFLKSWRDGAGDRVDQDLTDGEVFDWFAYLGKHPNGNMIFNGARIVAFTIAKLASMDSNTNQHRVDFCIFRDDGRMVRLHPSSSKEALPVECNDPSAIDLAGNRPREVRIDRRTHDGGKGDGKGPLPAAPQGQGGGEERATSYYSGISQADAVSIRRMQQHLDDRARKWEQNPAGFTFTLDITGSPSDDFEIAWHMYFADKPALQGLTAEGIEQVWVVWVGMEHNCPALYVRTSEREVVVQSAARRMEILPELVASIRWSV
jgi:hypothetical protein